METVLAIGAARELNAILNTAPVGLSEQFQFRLVNHPDHLRGYSHGTLVLFLPNWRDYVSRPEQLEYEVRMRNMRVVTITDVLREAQLRTPMEPCPKPKQNNLLLLL